MSEARPWLVSQQETIITQAVKDVEEYRNAKPDERDLQVYLGASKDLRWHATLRAVEAERDAARCTIDEILDHLKFFEEELSEQVPWRAKEES